MSPRPKVLIGPPKPSDPRHVRWPFIAALIALTAGVAGGIGWSAGVNTSWDGWRAADQEAKVAHEQLEQCLGAEGRVTASASHAGAWILRLQHDQEERQEYADMLLSRELVAEAPR